MECVSGNRLDWWEPSDDREFNNRTECLKDQYSSFNIPYAGREFSLDRSSEQGENIADNGAVKVAYRCDRSTVTSSVILTLAGVSWPQTYRVRRSVCQESLSPPTSCTGWASPWIGAPWGTDTGGTATTGSSSVARW